MKSLTERPPIQLGEPCRSLLLLISSFDGSPTKLMTENRTLNLSAIIMYCLETITFIFMHVDFFFFFLL